MPGFTYFREVLLSTSVSIRIFIELFKRILHSDFEIYWWNNVKTDGILYVSKIDRLFSLGSFIANYLFANCYSVDVLSLIMFIKRFKRSDCISSCSLLICLLCVCLLQLIKFPIKPTRLHLEFYLEGPVFALYIFFGIFRAIQSISFLKKRI